MIKDLFWQSLSAILSQNLPSYLWIFFFLYFRIHDEKFFYCFQSFFSILKPPITKIKESIMDETNEKPQQTVQKYLLLMKMICMMENRLVRFEMVYLIISIFISLSSTMSLSRDGFLGNFFVLFWPALGMFVCIFWITSSMRLQLKLKLRYFQARYLERKMDSAGENFCSDESIFFNREIRKIESPDKKELLQYPVKGFSRMDGFMGAAKSRYLTWILPGIFFFFYLAAWIYFLLGY